MEYIKVLGDGALGVRGWRVRKRGQEGWWGTPSPPGIVVRAAVPELLLWSQPSQTFSLLPWGPHMPLVLWPAQMDSNACSREVWTEDSPKPRSRQKLPLDVATGEMWVILL